jgi:hypothetical protein
VLVAEDPSAMTLVSDALCLFGHEVGNHFGRGGLAAEAIRISMWRETGLLAGWRAMVMAPLLSQKRVVRIQGHEGGSEG